MILEEKLHKKGRDLMFPRRKETNNLDKPNFTKENKKKVVCFF